MNNEYESSTRALDEKPDSGPKKWFHSKTFWINAITLAVGIVTVFISSGLLTEKQTAVLGLIVIPVLNIFLRWLTHKPITSLPGLGFLERLRG